MPEFLFQKFFGGKLPPCLPPATSMVHTFVDIHVYVNTSTSIHDLFTFYILVAGMQAWKLLKSYTNPLILNFPKFITELWQGLTWNSRSMWSSWIQPQGVSVPSSVPCSSISMSVNYLDLPRDFEQVSIMRSCIIAFFSNLAQSINRNSGSVAIQCKPD